MLQSSLFVRSVIFQKFFNNLMDTKSVQKNVVEHRKSGGGGDHVPLKDHGKEYKIDKLIT